MENRWRKQSRRNVEEKRGGGRKSNGFGLFPHRYLYNCAEQKWMRSRSFRFLSCTGLSAHSSLDFAATAPVIATAASLNPLTPPPYSCPPRETNTTCHATTFQVNSVTLLFCRCLQVHIERDGADVPCACRSLLSLADLRVPLQSRHLLQRLLLLGVGEPVSRCNHLHETTQKQTLCLLCHEPPGECMSRDAAVKSALYVRHVSGISVPGLVGRTA